MEHISIHALREEGDGAPHPAGARTQHFYPRPPRGGRRSRNSSFGKSKVFLSTPSARRATTRGLRRSCRGPISIHALREEGDAYTAECMEALKVFLSTPSARRATYARRRRADGYVISIHALREEGDRHLCRCGAGPGKISIHALREEGDTGGAGRKPSKNISIHALREEGDLPLSGAANVVAIFLSTPSTRRATRLPGGLGRVPDISIHALREEGDKAGEPVTIPINDFYPRPPRGGRPFALASHILVTDFYPRPPRGGRPVALPNEPGNRFISIHALREEGDVKGWLRATEVTRFLSTPSARRATARSALSAQVVRDFYPRPPRGGRRILPCFFPPKIIFLSTPSARRATPRKHRQRQTV